MNSSLLPITALVWSSIFFAKKKPDRKFDLRLPIGCLEIAGSMLWPLQPWGYRMQPLPQ